jgi:hypothetical protein
LGGTLRNDKDEESKAMSRPVWVAHVKKDDDRAVRALLEARAFQLTDTVRRALVV